MTLSTTANNYISKIKEKESNNNFKNRDINGNVFNNYDGNYNNNYTENNSNFENYSYNIFPGSFSKLKKSKL